MSCGARANTTRSADPATGVIDMFAGPTKDAMAVFPTRAVPLPDGRTAYTFTMFQGPDMPDELVSLALRRARMCEMLGSVVDFTASARR